MGGGIRHAVLAACILGGATGQAIGQDALRGKRIYHDGGRQNGAGISCVDCHGGFPGALHGIAKGAGNPGAIEYALGAIPQMAPLRGRVSRQDVSDLAAYLANPQVPSPHVRLATSGPAANAYSPERLVFETGAAVFTSGSVHLTNSGELAFSVLSVPVLTGPHADQFLIAGTDCAAGMVLVPRASCSVAVEFRPAVGAGMRSASLVVRHDWLGGGFGIALIGDVRTPARSRRGDPRK